MNFKRFQTEFAVVFKKKWFELRHDFFNFLFYGIASLVFTIITGCLSIVIFKSWNKTQVTEFNWANVRKRGSKFAFYGNTTMQPGIDQVKSAIEGVSGLTGAVFNSVQELEEEFYSTSDTNIYSFGVAADFFSSSAVVLDVYYNGTVESESETAKAEITSCLMDLLYNQIQPGSGFHVTYEPLNSGFDSVRLWGYFGPLLMSLALNYIGSIFATKPVEDRENFRLHSLLTSGLHLWVYWFATFVFDLCFYEVVNILCWLILVMFRTDAIIRNNWMATFFLFVFQPVHLLPLVYTLSLLFDTVMSVSQFLQVILLIVVLIPYFIITLIIGNENISDTIAAVVSMIPSYCIQNGLRVSSTRAVGKPIDAKEVWSGYFVILFAIEIGMGLIFAALGWLIHTIRNRGVSKIGKSNKKISNTEMNNTSSSENGENLENDEKNKALTANGKRNNNKVSDEDVIELERQVMSGDHDNEAIVVKNLVKEYVDSTGSTFKAVNDVSLFVQSGEIFGVLGANGAGKSTLMSVITGRTSATSGEILLHGGNRIINPSDSERFVSICPQFDTHLFPELTMKQHFWLYGKLMDFTDEEIEIEMNEYEALMNLGPHRDKMVKELSGGNARKLGISLAFLGRAPIIFLDEPTASLDPVARLQTQRLIEAKAEGRTILLCTHLLSEAEKLCNHICIMLSGRIHAFGTHQHLAEKYGETWKVDLGLLSDDEECRENVDRFVKKAFPGSEIAGKRFASVTYNIPSASIQLSHVFLILSTNKDEGIGYTYFTCSMSTLERVFLDIIMQAEI